jgi:hypothetical protein
MIDEKDIKPIPYGVSDFKKFRENNLYYVDKTRFIRDIERKGVYLFLIRPRRFGKSLLLSILESYYDITRKDQFDYLFNKTDIHQNPTPYKNSSMILTLDFSVVTADIEGVKKAFLTRIQNATEAFFTKYGKLLDIDIKEAKLKINSKETASEVMDTFLNYCLYREHKIYVVIDEYDNFANTILAEYGAEEFEKITHGTGFLRSFFNVLKAGTSRTDAPISRLFMTGVSPITLDDVTSGFNIATNISLDSDINEIMGFTYNEVETMIEYYRQTGKIRHSTPALLELMSQWYNHYRFSTRANGEVFNSVHVLYFLNKYMVDSAIPDTLIDSNARIGYEKLRHLVVIDKEGARQTNGNFSRFQHIIETGKAQSHIETSFPIAKLAQAKNFISLLFYFGLLTIRGMDEENTPVLAIPNETAKRLYYDYIADTYDEVEIFSLNQDTYTELMKGMAFKGNWEPFIKFIADCMEASLSLRDLLDGEKSHQVFWHVYMGLSLLYNVYSEKEMNQGFCDLVLEPLLANYPGIKFSYLVELKYIKPSGYEKDEREEKIEALCLEAETQLNRYSLDNKFQHTIGKTTLKKLVLIFSGNRLVHSSSS